MIKLFTVLVLACLLFTSIIAFQQVGAASSVIVVPDNYPSITAAIANSADGYVIYVRSGVYNESVLEIKKSVTICGENVRNTIVNLDPPPENFTCVMGHIHTIPSFAIKINHNDVKISGLTISSAGGISANGDGIEIISNIITIGRSCDISGSNVTIERNMLTGDDWRITGSYLSLTENTINASNNGVES